MELVVKLVTILCFLTCARAQAANLQFVNVTKLPEAREGHRVVYDGQDHIFILGGFERDRILKHELTTGLIHTLPGTFLTLAYGVATMTNRGELLYAGGMLSKYANYKDVVYSYNLTTDTYAAVGWFPLTVAWMPSVWNSDSQVGYTFGGVSSQTLNGDTNQIFRFSAGGTNVEELGRMDGRQGPGNIYQGQAVWHPPTKMAYIFNTNHKAGTQMGSPEIYQYNPTNPALPGQVTLLNTTLFNPPQPQACAILARDNKAYILGTGGITRFDPATELVDRIHVDNYPSKYPYDVKPVCAYVPKQDRVYVYLDDQVSYIDLTSATTHAFR